MDAEEGQAGMAVEAWVADSVWEDASLNTSPRSLDITENGDFDSGSKNFITNSRSMGVNMYMALIAYLAKDAPLPINFTKYLILLAIYQ